MIKAKNIKKSYGNLNVLRGLCLEVNEGEVYGLVGKNGVGKTTLLSILCGLNDVDTGFVEIDGKVVDDKTLGSGIVGYLPDVPAFFENLTIEEYLSFLIQGVDPGLSADKNSRMVELIDKMGLSPGIRIRKLSRGNRQKLGIVAAILAGPKVLLLDEPMSALDPMGRRDVVELIRLLRSEGMTIILSTHILSDIEQLCDRVGFLHEGVIAREVDFMSEAKLLNKCVIVFEKEAQLEVELLKNTFEGYEIECVGNEVTVVDKSEELTDEAFQQDIFKKISTLNLMIVRVERSESKNIEKIMESVLGN